MVLFRGNYPFNGVFRRCSLHYEKFQDGTVKCIEDEIPFEVPVGWEWCRLNSIVDVRDGTHDTPAYVDKGIPLITSKNLIEGGIDYSNVKYISEKDALSINERSGVNVGDILFAMIGTIGNPAMVTEDILISIKNVALLKFSFSDNLSNYFIMYYLDYAQEDMKKRPSGGLQPFVSLNFLRSYLVPVPPVEEQHKIVAIIADSISNIRSIDILKKDFTVSIEKAKSKILDLAIRGKLVPQDPNDEPASVLLERIRAEKEELIKQGKIKRDKKESIIFRGDDNSYYAMIDGNSMPIADYLGYNLPDGWAWISLKDIATITSGKTPKPEQLDSRGTVPYFKVADMNTLGNELYLKHAENYINDLYFGPVYDINSLVFPKNGGAVLTNKKRILAQDSVVDLNTGVFTPSRLLNHEFIFYLFSSIDFSKIYKGAVIPTVDSSVLGKLIYGLPPIKEQERISATIKSIFLKLEQIEIALT